MSAWMSVQDANITGAVLGGVFGVVGGGIGGPLIGYLAPRGKAKAAVLGAMVVLLAAGVGLLVTAAVAWYQSQPGYVVHPFLLVGGVVTTVVSGLLPVIRHRYREAEQRKLSAEEFRRG